MRYASNKIFLIFFGPPGSGKGTQVDMLAKKLKLPVICPGELLRHEIGLKTKIGKQVKSLVDLGKLVPDEIVEKIIDQRLKKPDAQKGAIFDGYPRRQKQLDFLIKRLARITSDKDYIYAILIDVSDREIKQRLSGRRACDCGAVYHLKYNPPKKSGICDLCGKKLYIRDDDKSKVIAGRLKLYYEQTKPLIDFWQKKGKLIKINGEQSIKDVEKEIWSKIKVISNK